MSSPANTFGQIWDRFTPSERERILTAVNSVYRSNLPLAALAFKFNIDVHFAVGKRYLTSNKMYVNFNADVFAEWSKEKTSILYRLHEPIAKG